MLAPLNLNEVRYHCEIPIFQYHQFQGNTNHCGPTSLAIAANAFLQEDRFQGQAVAQELDNWWPLFPDLFFPRVKNWMTFPWGIVQYLRKSKVPARWLPLGQPNTLIQNLLADRITIVVIGEKARWHGGRYAGWGHIKVLFGYHPGRGFVFVDPAYPKFIADLDPWNRAGLFWQTEDEFIRQWRSLFGIYIEVGNVN